MSSRMLLLFVVLASAAVHDGATAQTRLSAAPQAQSPSTAQKPSLPAPATVPSPRPALGSASTSGSASGIVAAITLADIGFMNGFRLANLGGRREVFVPLPQKAEVKSMELVLVIDDVSAHDARRNLEVLVNDRSAAAIPLDGRSRGRTVRVPLQKSKESFLKISFIYSGAATPDRCIDVRYVGDSLTIRSETAIEVGLGGSDPLDIATTFSLMPRDVSVVMPDRKLVESELMTALTVGRTLVASGRRVRFHQGFDTLHEISQTTTDSRRWSRGIVLIGMLDEVSAFVEAPAAKVAGPPLAAAGGLAAVRVGGAPALLVSDPTAGQLLASPWLMAARGMSAASVGEAMPSSIASDRITFEQLGVGLVQAEVFGRADLTTAVDMRRLPMGMRASRLLLDVMVAPDGSGEKAVVSVFINEQMLGSTVAAINEPTHLDLQLPAGLVGTTANVRVVVQRRSAQGDCRFEPQGYPAQILGSSAFMIAPAESRADDFSDLATRWSKAVEVWLPDDAAARPAQVLGLVAGALASLSSETMPITVKLAAAGAAPAPQAAFVALNGLPPENSTPRVRFDRGRIIVTDRSGKTLLDLSGHSTGALVQLVNAGPNPGIWIKSFAPDGALPEPADLKLDHGNVAFIDEVGVALIMSTERDTLVRISYPEQVSWLTVADRLRFWIVAGLWLFATAAVLLLLQRMLRRKPAGGAEE